MKNKKKSGQVLGEWMLIVSLVACVTMVTLFSIADRLREMNGSITTKMDQGIQSSQTP